ncbi:Quinolinate phosphoribosyltransferase [Arcticibacter svalbardensis MN12-7]|uniref:Probable nicotinate-nucleotide pyrophosphorylase [carboxylating] n=1 Tax=Arcticibacter svalbardensis MN12-7 TaxID=1150600 RepID=R9GXS0_9SPHI|nr:carboxylating nicotinate-nucleotide diphosphorylase [Arcticibacter svalbardensis]EOR96602.1 Quinolinate phosphoribosyltransferase [Arcticibacter svalbardensis MN12-7]
MKDYKELLTQFIANALAEDLGSGDHTSLSTIPVNKKGEAKLIIKDKGVLAGVDVALAIFKQVDADLQVHVLLADGAKVEFGDIALTVEGNVSSILIAERLVLNTMQRMSGIASTTARIVAKLKDTNTRVLDTRKTTPNLRFLEKQAVVIGGGVNHRIGLYDMILIKDNHVDYAGGIKNALLAAKAYIKDKKLTLEIEIEVRTISELEEVIEAGGADRILLDNFSFENLKSAVNLIHGRFPTEASGGISEENVLEYAQCGVDFISMGALTHSVKSLDMSLKATN